MLKNKVFLELLVYLFICTLLTYPLLLKFSIVNIFFSYWPKCKLISLFCYSNSNDNYR